MSLVDRTASGSGELVVVLTTVADETAAQTLARALLEGALAACVQLSRIDSLYLWEGQLAEDAEVRMTIKTPAERRDAVVAAIAAAHPYDVPQIVVLGAEAVHAPYLAWARDVTAPA